MDYKALKKYSQLYQTPRYLSADSAFRKFLSLDIEAVVPLSISHGVDFGHCYEPMDIFNPEPIHWSYNLRLHQRALKTKPSLLIPHPWAIWSGDIAIPKGEGTLLIGPPPGPMNDSALYELVKAEIKGRWSVLVKPRGNISGSISFWQSKNIQPIMLSQEQPDYFQKLIQLISEYRKVVSGTLSSVLVFSAALGREIEIKPEYVHITYENAYYEDEVDMSSQETKDLVKIFAYGCQSEIAEASRSLLGYDYLNQFSRISEAYKEIIHNLQNPLWSDPSLLTPFLIRRGIAFYLNKPVFVNIGFKKLLSRFVQRESVIMTICEFDMWLNGKNSSNFRLESVPRKKERSVPGHAVSGYPL